MNDFYDRLDALYQAEDLAAVESYIRGELEHIERALGSDAPEYAAVLNELAGFMRGVSRYAESENTFRQALAILQVKGAGLSPQYATILLNLAGLFRLTGRADEAVRLFQEAKRLLTATGDTNSYAYASVLNNLSLAYQDAGEFEAALQSAQEAFALQKQLGLGDHELATALNNLAVICLRSGMAIEAENYINQALAVYDGMTETDVHHAAALTTKALLLYRTGRFTDAQDLFTRARDLTVHFFGKNIEYAASERHLAMTSEALGDQPNAIEHLQEAAVVYTELLGPAHERTAACRTMLEQLRDRVSKS
jgi:tetratricopeptide (TPR) repeat protein